MRWFLPLVLTFVLCGPAAAGAAPRAVDASVRFGDSPPTARAASSGDAPRWWTSRVVRPERPVHVLGLRWRSAPEEFHGEVRVRTRAGRWLRWTEMADADSTGGSDPVWAGGASAVQVRLRGRVRGLRLHLVNVRGAATPAVRARAAARRRQLPAGAPPIIPRSEWGADTQCAPRDAPTLGEVQMGFVHHTVSANEYAPEDSAAMVLGICRFHRNGNGWDDIGYNFLVDKYGQVFEGRAGGIDQPVVGAQAQGFNGVSTGVANLGTYSDVPQTDAAVDAMARLLAWKLPLHGAPVSGEVTVTSAGGSSNRYPQGRAVTFQRISGHRDGNSTECPGARLYAQLPDLRARAAGVAPFPVAAPAPAGGTPARLTLQAARRALAYPEPARLTGRVLDAAGAGVAGTPVKLQLLTARGFKAMATATSGPDGVWSAELPTARNRVVRVLVGKLVSNRVRLTVAPALSVPVPARRVQAGRRAVLRGEIHPRRARLRVYASRQLSPTRFAKPIIVRGRASGGRFRIPVALVRPGLYRLRVSFEGDRLNAPARVDHWVRAVRRLASSPPPPSSSGGLGGQAAP